MTLNEKMDEASHNLKIVLLSLEKLVQRLDNEDRSSVGAVVVQRATLDSAISDSLKEFYSDFKQFTSEFPGGDSDFGSDQHWQFVDVTCSLLIRLCGDQKNSDISLSQQIYLRKCVLWIVLLGVLPNLIKGVGVPLKILVSPMDSTEELGSIQKYRRLCSVVKVLVQCVEHPALRCVFINFLSNILAALCQLGFAPLKKPTIESGTELSKELYESFLRDQLYYQSVLSRLINGIYQPRVIQELMIVLGQRVRTPPLWLKKTCSHLLTQILLSPGGVSAVIRSTMESDIDTGTDWKTVNVLIKIITSPEKHHENICHQLVEVVSGSDVTKSCRVVSIACMNELLLKNPNLVQSIIVEKLLKPLSSLSVQQLECSVQAGDIVIKEEDFSSSIDCLHRCFAVKTSSSNPSCLPSSFLHPVLNILFALYGQIRESVSHVNQLVADLLYCVFSDCPPTKFTDVIRAVVFREPLDEMLSLGEVSFVLGNNGGVEVVKSDISVRGIEYSYVEDTGDTLMYLLGKKDTDCSVSYAVFVSLLQILSDFGIAPKNLEACDKILGTVEDAISELVIRSERHVGAVRLLAALAEKSEVQRRLSKQPDSVVGFLEILLRREICNVSKPDNSEFSDDEDILCVALMILEAVINGNRQEINWDSFKSLVPLLDELKKLPVNSEIKTLSSHIFCSIVTKGVVRVKANEDVDTERQENRAKFEQPSKYDGKSACENALNDACDPLLPVRGHAIVKLTELISAGDREAVAKKDAILCIFLENLKNDDSFIYLAAINGIAALTGFFPDTVLSTLTEEFAQAVSAGSSDLGEENLTRMKIGEVLLKVTRLLGEMASKYRSQLLNAFLLGVKDVDPLVRTSSLSNLGEVCRVLGFRVGPVLQEILLCIRNVINSDKNSEPRRAAVLVVTLLLQGLDKDALSILADDNLLLYRALKQLYLRESDEVMRLHVQLALDEMNRIVRDFLFPEINSQRKIVMS